MATGKESPRQKMIGMMYLVLTALLALQVSSAVIYKFQSLNQSLERSAEDLEKLNSEKLAGIDLAVTNRGNQESDIKIRNEAQEVNKKTREVLQEIEDIKAELIKETGGYDEDGNLKGAKEETELEVIMIGATKNGKAYALKKKLEAYQVYMNSVSGTKFSPLALDGKDDPLFKNNEDQKKKDFAQLNFGQTPLVAGLAVLSEIQSRITSMEATSLTQLHESIDAHRYKVDGFEPMVTANSNIIPAGLKYEGKMFLVARSSTLQQSMEFGGRTIAVDGNGIGNVSFTATGGNYVNDRVKKTWIGKIKTKTPDGRDTTYSITQEYTVVKPVIQVQGGPVNTLYRNCGNRLSILVPALGAAFNPGISAEGAIVEQVAGPAGSIVVLPTGTKVNLKVSSNGNFIGEQKFGVKLIPLPTIKVEVNGRTVDPIKGVRENELRMVKVSAIAEKNFEAAQPEDATYKVTKWKAQHARNGRIKNSKDCVNESENLGLMGSETKLNDWIIIEIKEVKRKNFRGQWELVNIPSNLVTIVPISGS